MAKSSTGLGRPGAQTVKLGSCIDERYQGVPEAETQNDERRKNWISNAVRFVLVHPNKDLLLQELRKQLQRGVRAPELEREGCHEAAGERGRVRVMHIDSKRCNAGIACDLQPYGISIASAGRYFFNLMKTQKPANKYENSTWSGASVSPLRGSY